MYKKMILLSIIINLLIFTGCAQKENSSKRDYSTRQINAVTTIGMIADAVKNVGGERVNVTGLMGPGVDPHLYKASEGDVSRMASADVIFYNGLHLEGKMTEVFEQMQQRIKTVAVTDGIDRYLLLSPKEFKGAHDPHIWFDVILWMAVIEKIRDTLIEMDPDNMTVYWNNSQQYVTKLVELQKYITGQLNQFPLEKRILITAHDAFNYFGRAYDFEVRGLQGISTATEAGAGDVQTLAQYIADNTVSAIFVETSVPLRNIEALQAAVKSRGYAAKIGGSLFSDAMGDPSTPEGTYIGMVRHNVNTIVNALSGAIEE